jgi:hypothetical protein
MSYEATVDIVLALNALRITSFHKQGLLCFKVRLQCHSRGLRRASWR